MSRLETVVLVSSLPAGIRAALRECGYKRADVNVYGQPECSLSPGSTARVAVAVNVPDLNSAAIEAHYGQFGGPNGFNQPRRFAIPGKWDPDFDQDAKPVPPSGAIVTTSGGKYASVYVTPATLAALIAPTSPDTMVAGDAAIEGRTDDADALARRAVESTMATLTDDECSVLYAYGALKSGEYRQRLIARRETAVESLVARGMLKRASNGATQITVAGKALRSVWNHYRYDREVTR